MDDQQALAIVSALANGANPLTGEMFAADSPYQAPDVIRAMFAAQRALEARLLGRQPSAQPSQPRAASTSTSTNAGKPWTSEEDKQLLAEFDADKPLAEIVRTHGRTINGVRARLEKHGRLEPSTATRWPSDRTNKHSESSDRIHPRTDRRPAEQLKQPNSRLRPA